MATLETIISLAFIYSFLALLTSSFKELLESIAQKRKKDMKGAIEDLLGPEGAVAFFKANIISTVNNSKTSTAKADDKRDWPSYIEAKTFAKAVAQLLDDEKLKDALLKSPLGAAISSVKSDAEKTVEQIERLYTQRMERLSGSFKRNAQWWLFGLGLFVAAFLDADTIRIASELGSDTAVRASVVALAEKSTDAEKLLAQCKKGESKPKEPGKTDDGKSADSAAKSDKSEKGAAAAPANPAKPEEQKKGGEGKPEAKTAPDAESKPAADVALLTKCLQDSMPGLLGWTEAKKKAFDFNSNHTPLMILGYILTALAISLGAPFWFDLLGKISNLRSTLKPIVK